MPKMTREERAELERRLADDDADDGNDEVEVGFSDGSYVRGAYHRVKRAAHARGVKLEADEHDGDGHQADEPKAQAKRFQSGRRV